MPPHVMDSLHCQLVYFEITKIYTLSVCKDALERLNLGERITLHMGSTIHWAGVPY